MKDILIIAHFTQIPGEKGNGRFRYIAEEINKEYANVEVVTTSFSHTTKIQRSITDKQRNSVNYKLTMLYEPGYNKNVSLKRFYSHYIMGRNLKKYLKTRKNPDVIYCSVPSLDVAKVAAEHSKRNNIRFIIDIQDLWPEAFKMVFNIPIMSDVIFYPMIRQANKIYKSADEIIAVSETYLDRALKVNQKQNKGSSIYLGTDLDVFDEFAKNKEDKPENEIWIAYIGTLGHSYDIEIIIDALVILSQKGIKNIKFKVIGDGPLKNQFENYAKNKDIKVEFTGRLEYKDMVSKLVSCDIAVNPIRTGSAGSIINKVGDYAAAGLPVINTQECIEYRELLNEYEAGLNCINGDVVDVAEKICILLKDEKLRIQMVKNSRQLAEDKFDRIKTYQKIVDVIEAD